MAAAAPVIWVGLECVRNYFLTGISALMLGHTMADVPVGIQIADLFGSYGVSFVLVSINVALDSALRIARAPISRRACVAGIVSGLLLATATIGYGSYRLRQPLGSPLSNFALIQLSEPIEYVQSDQCAVEIFQNYLMQTQKTLAETDSTVDAVVWPESMFTAGLPWMILGPDAAVPEEANVSSAEFADFVSRRRDAFGDRVALRTQRPPAVATGSLRRTCWLAAGSCSTAIKSRSTAASCTSMTAGM